MRSENAVFPNHREREDIKCPCTQTRVACVGDSITELTDYPHQLSQMLGETYSVGDFGICGSKVLLNSDNPYRYTNAFSDTVQFQPDIVVIMLGTNDASSDLEAYRGHFLQDYQSLIKDFQLLPCKPQIFMVLPPPIFNENLGLSIDAFNRGIIPAIKEAAKNEKLSPIDVYSALCSPRFFFDGVHPNEEGAKIIAEIIYQSLATN
jgi:acyl-CoA thioesterase I